MAQNPSEGGEWSKKGRAEAIRTEGELCIINVTTACLYMSVV